MCQSFKFVLLEEQHNAMLWKTKVSVRVTSITQTKSWLLGKVLGGGRATEARHRHTQRAGLCLWVSGDSKPMCGETQVPQGRTSMRQSLKH